VSRYPGLVSEKAAKGQLGLPMVIALGAGRNGTAVPEYLAAHLDKLRNGIRAVVYRQVMS
jgi:hypothetical protein